MATRSSTAPSSSTGTSTPQNNRRVPPRLSLDIDFGINQISTWILAVPGTPSPAIGDEDGVQALPHSVASPAVATPPSSRQTFLSVPSRRMPCASPGTTPKWGKSPSPLGSVTELFLVDSPGDFDPLLEYYGDSSDSSTPTPKEFLRKLPKSLGEDNESDDVHVNIAGEGYRMILRDGEHDPNYDYYSPRTRQGADGYWTAEAGVWDEYDDFHKQRATKWKALPTPGHTPRGPPFAKSSQIPRTAPPTMTSY